MTFSLVITQHLPTLALVSLGASETAVGIQSALGQALEPLRLPTLRAVARFPKRVILIAGQVLAQLGALPLVFFGPWIASRGEAGVPWVVASVGMATAGLIVSGTVWFPILRGYVESDRTGRFFGVLRTGWHLSLILYYAAALRWLALRPGEFGPLFAAGWLCGLLRIALIWRLPERSERTGRPIRVREALALLRDRPDLRRFLTGVTTAAAVRACVLPFVMVMMRRELGFGDSEVLALTVALFGGGLVSLYVWGWVVDRHGPMPVFRWTSAGNAFLTLALCGATGSDAGTLALLVAVVFGISVLSSGFGVADTRVLFELTPEEAPARTLVVASVTVTMLAGLAPLVVGVWLDHALAATAHADGDRLAVYRVFFATAAAVRLLAYVPLRSLGART